MEKVEFTIQMDADLKKQLDAVCDEVGMTTSTAITMFAKAFVRERTSPEKIASAGSISKKQIMPDYNNKNGERF